MQIQIQKHMQVQIQKQGRSSRFPGWWIFSCCSRKQGGGLEVERSKLWRWKGRKTAFEQNLLLRTLLHFNGTLQTLQNVHCTLDEANSALRTSKCTLHTAYWTLKISYCTNAQCKRHSTQCTRFKCTLHNHMFTLRTAHCTWTHWTLHMYTLNTAHSAQNGTVDARVQAQHQAEFTVTWLLWSLCTSYQGQYNFVFSIPNPHYIL